MTREAMNDKGDPAAAKNLRYHDPPNPPLGLTPLFAAESVSAQYQVALLLFQQSESVDDILVKFLKIRVAYVRCRNLGQ